MMNTTLHLAIPWLIVISAALVCFNKKWRFTGAVILVSQLLYSSMREEIKVFASLEMGEFNALYDLSTAVVLALFGKRLNSVDMGLILCGFVIVHSALGISVQLNVYSIFWSQYVNFILMLNLLQLYYFSKGIKNVIHEFIEGHIMGNYFIFGGARNSRFSIDMVSNKKEKAP